MENAEGYGEGGWKQGGKQTYLHTDARKERGGRDIGMERWKVKGLRGQNKDRNEDRTERGMEREGPRGGPKRRRGGGGGERTEEGRGGEKSPCRDLPDFANN